MFFFISHQIAFKMHSVRWNRSQSYFRWGLFLLILAFSVPNNLYSLYCHLTPLQKNLTTEPLLKEAPKVEPLAWKNILSKTNSTNAKLVFNNFNTSHIRSILERAQYRQPQVSFFHLKR